MHDNIKKEINFIKIVFVSTSINRVSIYNYRNDHYLYKVDFVRCFHAFLASLICRRCFQLGTHVPVVLPKFSSFWSSSASATKINIILDSVSLYTDIIHFNHFLHEYFIAPPTMNDNINKRPRLYIKLEIS